MSHWSNWSDSDDDDAIPVPLDNDPVISEIRRQYALQRNQERRGALVGLTQLEIDHDLEFQERQRMDRHMRRLAIQHASDIANRESIYGNIRIPPTRDMTTREQRQFFRRTEVAAQNVENNARHLLRLRHQNRMNTAQQTSRYPFQIPATWEELSPEQRRILRDTDARHGIDEDDQYQLPPFRLHMNENELRHRMAFLEAQFRRLPNPGNPQNGFHPHD